VTVDPGGLIAESNEQNNSRSEMVPVPTQPLPCNSTSTPTPTPASATATPTATTSSTSGWNTSQFTKYSFSFKFPPGSSIASQSDNSGRIYLPITAGTNLSEKYVDINIQENTSPCISPAVDGTVTSTENVTINNIQFTKQVGQGVAAGNIYDWNAYLITRNNACLSLAFILHSTNPGNYPTPPPVFNMAAESAVFATIMSPLNFTQ